MLWPRFTPFDQFDAMDAMDAMSRSFGSFRVLLLAAAASAPVAAAAVDDPPAMTAAEAEHHLTEKFQLGHPSRRYCRDAPLHPRTWTDEEKAAQRQALDDAQARLDTAVAEHAAAFTFPPGVYRFSGKKGIRITSATNMTIHASDCEFVREPVDDAFAGFLFKKCRDVVLAGPLILDSEAMPYFQGTIIEASEPGPDATPRITVRPMPGYGLRPGQRTKPGRIMIFDENSGSLLSVGQWGGFVAADNPDGTVTVTGERWGRNADSARVGRILALEGQASAFEFRDCANMTIDGFASYAGGMFGDGVTDGHYIVRNFRLIPRPGTNRLVANQVVQPFYTSDFLVEDSEFGVGWDDGINFIGKMGMVYRQSGPREIVAGRDATVGAELRFFMFDGFAPVGTATVVACEPLTDAETKAAMTEDFQAFLAARKRTGNWVKRPARITLDRDLLVPPNAVIDEVRHDRPCSITVRRTVWSDLAAQAILIRGARRGLIENNLFMRSAGSAIAVGFDYFWAEGPIPNNVTIRGNVIRDNPRDAEGLPTAAINVFADVADPSGNNAILHGMVIEGNLIVGPTAGGIRLGNVGGGVIRNNVIDFSASPAPRLPQSDRAGAIVVENSSDIVVEGNAITCTPAHPNEILVLGNCDRDTVVVRENAVRSAPAPRAMRQFSAVWALGQPQGSQGWRFQHAPPDGAAVEDMPTPFWWVGDAGNFGLGYVAADWARGGRIKARAGGRSDVVLTFAAPRSGTVRIDCGEIANEGPAVARIAIRKNGENLWPSEGSETVPPHAATAARLETPVAAGDTIQFRVGGGTLFLAPVITYEE